MKWEYHFTNVEYPDNVAGKQKKVGLLRELGANGWELVSVDNGIAYFKRPVEYNEVLFEYINELHQVGQLSDYSKDKILSLL
jgi:hypothetical protein